MAFASRLLREPLVHFVAAGAVLFTVFAAVRGPEASWQDEATIVIDRDTLLTYMQYRANAFEPTTFAAALDAMPESERRALIDAYLDEEALYREAKLLGLEESDYIIRQRMVQKVKFLLTDIAESNVEPDEQALEAYFAEHADRYAIEPSVTFTHVFFDASRRGAEEARRAAHTAVDALNEKRLAFDEAPGEGDRFPFLKNYVERTFGYVASQFGAEFAAALAELPASTGTWQGPIASAYGQHVVLLTRRTEESLPRLEDVRAAVERDFVQDVADRESAQMTQAVRERYRAVLADDLFRARTQ